MKNYIFILISISTLISYSLSISSELGSDCASMITNSSILPDVTLATCEEFDYVLFGGN